MALETLFLDAGGVLVHPNWQRVSDTLARHGMAVAPDALRRADPPARFAIDQGTTIAPTTDAERAWPYMYGVLRNAGVTSSPAVEAALAELAVYHAEQNLWEHVPADVVPALKRLRGLALRLVVVSNANGALHRAFDRLGLTADFDVICDSCVQGVEKPDPRFFAIALARSGGTAATTTHVGDLYHVDVVGARRAGLQAILLDAAGLYEGYDCERVSTLDALVDAVARARHV